MYYVCSPWHIALCQGLTHFPVIGRLLHESQIGAVVLLGSYFEMLSSCIAPLLWEPGVFVSVSYLVTESKKRRLIYFVQ